MPQEPTPHPTRIQTIRSLLSFPSVYDLWWKAVGGPNVIGTLRKYLNLSPGTRLLEIGCGPGVIFSYLPRGVDYLGFDISPEYIATAQKRFPQARFICERVSDFTLDHEGSFDVVLALGVVHHLDDEESKKLFQIGHRALRPRGSLITVDGVWADGQSPFARWMLRNDRGEHVRSEDEYLRVAGDTFTSVNPSIHHDLLRIPYSHLILQCVR